MSWWELFRQLTHGLSSHSSTPCQSTLLVSRFKAYIEYWLRWTRASWAHPNWTKHRNYMAARAYWQKSSGWLYGVAKID